MHVVPLSAIQVAPDSSVSDPGPYDSVWAQTTAQSQPQGIETVMLAEDKLYVVLAVVLIIWAGIVFFLFRTDRRIQSLERSASEDIGSSEDDESMLI